MNKKIVYAKDFGLSTGLYDNHEKLQNCLDYCKKINASKLIIEPGVYKFHNQKALTINMQNFEIFAENVEFSRRKQLQVSIKIKKGCDKHGGMTENAAIWAEKKYGWQY